MANVWVGTDYYVPEINQSGDDFVVTFNSTTTSNTYNYVINKNITPPNPESVGAATMVWINWNTAGNDRFDESSDNSRRLEISPSSTTSANGTGLVTELAIASNGFLNLIYSDSFDQINESNNRFWHVKSGGTGWQQQDNISFTNIWAGHDTDNVRIEYDFIGNIIWTDKDGPNFYEGAPEVALASNATFYVNCAIRANTWIP